MTKKEWTEKQGGGVVMPTPDCIKYLGSVIWKDGFKPEDLGTEEVARCLSMLLTSLYIHTSCGGSYEIPGEILYCKVKYKNQNDFEATSASGLFPKDMWIREGEGDGIWNYKKDGEYYAEWWNEDYYRQKRKNAKYWTTFSLQNENNGD